MNLLLNNFPYFKDKEECLLLKKRPYINYNKTLFIAFSIIFYPLCFGLGMMMFTYHSKFIHAACYFLILLLISFIIIAPLYMLLSYGLLLINNNKSDIYLGLNLKSFNCYATVNNFQPIKQYLWVKALIVILTIFISTLVFIFFRGMLTYAIFCSCNLLSVHNILDVYLLFPYRNKKIQVINIKEKLYVRG